MYAARIKFNSQGWQRPTGEAGSLEVGNTYSQQHGFGLEDWLFRTEWVLDGWRYGQIVGAYKSRKRLLTENMPLDVILYTIEPGKRRRYVARIHGVECLTDELAEEALRQYKKRGWFNAMLREVGVAGGEADVLAKIPTAIDIFSVRFRPENVHPCPADAYLSPDDPVAELKQYQLADLASMYQKRGRTFDPGYIALSKQVTSAVRFRRAFERFQKIEVAAKGKRLRSFRDADTLAYEWEDYKESLARRAEDILVADKWSKKQIGSGEILDRVIAAIEWPGNNLLQWQNRYGEDKREHAALIDARQKRNTRQDLEALFYEIYKAKHTTQKEFDALVAQVGATYPLVAYLFFIADRHRFLPIRTRLFDRVFEELGLTLRTSGRCSWQNYAEYLHALGQVKTWLHAEGVVDATLLDAHSFCWILGKHEPEEDTGLTELRIEGRTFAGVFDTPVSATDRGGSGSRLVPAAEWNNLHERRMASGRVAEEVALRYEQQRLREAGQEELAARVALVGEDPTLGYDIQSFDGEDAPRHIEVKNVSKGSRFFISINEWRKSQNLDNYWLYLVSGTETAKPRVELVKATDLGEENLQPISYLVSFSR